MKEYRNKNGKYHRLDGPAIVYPNGTKFWYQNGLRHRLDGPAVEWSDSTKEWYQNGLRHRLDGPAVEYPDGIKYWLLNGYDITEQVESWIKEQGVTVPFDNQTQVLFLLRYG